ncbi:MAG TPA: hypothetical protein VGH10_05940 [Actinomycetota bacterium]
MSRRRAVVAAAAAAGALMAAACGSATADSLPPPPASVIYNPEPSTGPFVVVAIDNHFHDIHPIDQTHIAENRPFIVKNEGRNLHNFTVVGTNISVDIRPGHSLVWRRLGAHLQPGFYEVICKYHAYLGMTGSFWVTKPSSGTG